MPLIHLYEAWLRDKYWTESRADEIHRVTCDDGVKVSVKRFLPSPDAPIRRRPVILVPGLGADSHNFDAPEPSGLAPYLARNGFDVFAVDLRGTGLSEIEPKRWSSITFDDFLHHDLPSTTAHIKALTGAPSVLAIGHSMGGMLLYAALGSHDVGADISAAITLCSPVGFPNKWEVAPGMRPLRWLGEHIPGIHAGRMMRWLIPLALSSSDFASHRFLARNNVDTEYIRTVMFRAVQDIPRGVLLQFRDWVMHDAFRSVETVVDYRAALANVKCPVLVVGAPKDKLARVDAVARALPLLPKAEFFLAAKSEGLSADYGHIDVIFGKSAHDELFPRFLAFLVTHDSHDDEDVPASTLQSASLH